MKTIGLEHATLDACIKGARHERVVITRKGKPVALVIGIEGLDEEQLQLGSSEKFWTLIEGRRKQKTISRAELERRIKDGNGSIEETEEEHEARARHPTPNKRAALDRGHVAGRKKRERTRSGRGE
jgi:antitoxin (DNA-binding transcriptional repressor) of toxin-antitoxin stability system